MAVVTEACPRCSAEVQASIRERMRGEYGPVWRRSIGCVACGYTEEADHGGALPDPYRALILAQEGTWELVVPGAGDRRKVVAAARDAFALDGKAAVRFARDVPGVVLSGTPVEVAWFGCLLARMGVVSLTRPVGET